MLENQIEIIGNNREIELLEKNRKINIQKLFTPEGMDLIIAEIENEAADFTADITTKKGQAEIKSMAAKVARCKAPIKNLAMELKEDSKKFIDGVNSQYNRYESAIDALRDKIRKPVDEIEEKEAEELKARQDRLAEIESYKMRASLPARTSKFLELSIRELKELAKFEWNDFAFKAENLVNEVTEILNQELVLMKKQETDAAELAELKKEKAERDKKDHEEKIAREAAEKVKREIEEQTKLAEQAKINAENRAKEAERLAKERVDIAEKNRIAAEKKAKEDAEKAAIEAVEKERKRVEEEAKKEREAAEKREANKKHRAKINSEILKSIMIRLEIKDEDSIQLLKQTIIEIANGEVPHIQINY